MVEDFGKYRRVFFFCQAQVMETFCRENGIQRRQAVLVHDGHEVMGWDPEAVAYVSGHGATDKQMDALYMLKRSGRLLDKNGTLA